MNYKSLLYEIRNAAMNNDSNLIVNVPSNKTLYTIDLNTRKIDGPSFISVQGEHYAETIYFLVDRFYDNMDLAQTNCVIQYVINDEAYVYAVPFCDITTYDGKIIIPWSISLSATQTSGTIQYFVRFYLISESSLFSKEGVYNPEGAEFSYSLSTLPASGIIRSSLETEKEFTIEDTDLKLPERYFEFVNLVSRMMDNATIYWHEAKDEETQYIITTEDLDTNKIYYIKVLDNWYKPFNDFDTLVSNKYNEEHNGYENNEGAYITLYQAYPVSNQVTTTESLVSQIQHMPYMGENGHWWIGDIDTGISSSDDYNNLKNKPTINGITIEGDMTDKLNIQSTEISSLLQE